MRMSSNTAWLFRPSFGTAGGDKTGLIPAAKSAAPFGGAAPSLTCAEEQQHLHAQVLVVGDLQPDKLAGDLQHLLALVGHVGQLHALPGGRKQTSHPNAAVYSTKLIAVLKRC